MFEKILSEYTSFDEKYPLTNSMNFIRNKSFKNFEQKGIPTIQNEEWRYTNLIPVFNQDFKLTSDANFFIDYNKLKKYFVTNIDTYKLIFINGVFNSLLSETMHEEFDIYLLSYAFREEKYELVMQSFYSTSPNHNDAFFSLNTSFSNEGSYIHIRKNTTLTKPIEIINFTLGEKHAVMIHPRTFVLVEENSKVQIIDSHQNIGKTSNLTNYVCEVFVHKNSQVDIYKIQNDTLDAQLIDSTSIIQQQNSVAKVHTFSIGGKFTRNNLNFYQRGENCNSILNGITLIGGHQLVDHHSLVDHFVPNCESNELYRGIFGGNSTGIFNGRIIVDQEAQKTNAFQKNDNLILSNNAQVNTKPELQIFADNVKCSHGCTIGQLNKEALFYLQSRGISRKESLSLLIMGFNSDILESIEIPQIKNKISDILKNKLRIQMELDF